MVGRRYRKKIESLEARIEEHRAKIEAERRRTEPDEALIAHWLQEIEAFESAIRRIRKSLGRP